MSEEYQARKKIKKKQSLANVESVAFRIYRYQLYIIGKAHKIEKLRKTKEAFTMVPLITSK